MRGSLEPQYSLNPVFVEWLMGLPAGWVTDVPDLTPNQQLRLLGNGVVPQQGAAALTYLLDQAPAFVRAWLATRHRSAAAAA